MTESFDAVVVGAGPNGLAAAITLAQRGYSVKVIEASPTAGGGLRSSDLGMAGLVHDVCSAVHPFGIASPFFATLPLADHGAEWIHPEIPVTQPLPDGTAAAAFRSLDRTVEELGRAGRRYRRLLAPLVDSWSDVIDDVLQPVVRVPSHPITFARFGLRAMLPSTWLAHYLADDRSAGLLAGAAAHAILPLDRPFTGGAGILFLASAHATGWPIVRGGSGRLAEALVDHFITLGGVVETDHLVTDIGALPPARATLLDVTPRQAATMLGSRISGRLRARMSSRRVGPGVFKVDYELSEPVPWTDPWSGRAGTVHVGGPFAEVARAEAAVASGRHPDAPFVLVTQQSVVDDTRTPDHRHTLWAYCHVPNGSTVDMTNQIEAQIERFAPGFTDTVLRRHRTNTAALEAYNPAYLGGDIAGGSMGGLNALFRGRATAHPYRTPADGVFLCSASTPPGAGVHGMCGHLAALDAIATSLG